MINYEEIILKEARFYVVEISSIRSTNDNDVRTWRGKKYIQLPKNISSETIFTCFLGLANYSVKKCKPLYVFTYKRYMWAIERMQYYGLDTTGLIEKTKLSVLYDLTSYNNKRGDIDKLDPIVKNLLSDIEPDFTSWRGNLVYNNGYILTKYPYKPIANAIEKRKASKRARIAKMINKEKDNE
jgi:hypothetical protein